MAGNGPRPRPLKDAEEQFYHDIVASLNTSLEHLSELARLCRDDPKAQAQIEAVFLAVKAAKDRTFERRDDRHAGRE